MQAIVYLTFAVKVTLELKIRAQQKITLNHETIKSVEKCGARVVEIRGAGSYMK